MKESIHAAASFVRSRSPRFGIAPPEFEKTDVHVHVPEGATPKTVLGRRRHGGRHHLGADRRADPQGLAMTGEITLRGRVLPIGG